MLPTSWATRPQVCIAWVLKSSHPGDSAHFRTAELQRLLRTAGPAPQRAANLFTELTVARTRTRLLVSSRVTVPFSCGPWRPAVVLPLTLAETAPPEVLRWVLVHELAHVQRRDADAAAVAAGRPEDYAQFLLDWAKAPAAPAGATGVKGRSSELMRRITMLLQNGTSVERECPRRWSRLMACGLLGLAVVGGGVGLRALAAPAPEKKETTSKEEAKKEEAGTEVPGKADDKAEPKKGEKARGRRSILPGGVLPPELEEIFKQFQPLEGDSGDVQKQMEQVREQLRKALEHGGLPAGSGLLGFADRRLMAPPRLGVKVEKPSDALIDQLGLPRDQSLVLAEVLPDSAAAKAGLKANDVLLELNGKPVPADVARFHKDLAAIKANTKVDAVVLRKGKKETIKGLTLPEAKPVTEGRRFPALPRLNRVVPDSPRGKGRTGAPAASQTTLVRNNDDFTAKERHGDQLITVTGKVVDGKATVAAIEVKDGTETKHFDSMDKVPAEYRDRVHNLVEMAKKGIEAVDINATK